MKREVSTCCGAAVKLEYGWRFCAQCRCSTRGKLVDVEPKPNHAEAHTTNALVGEAQAFVKGHVEPMSEVEIATRNKGSANDG